MGGEPGGEAVTAAAVALGDAAHVDLAERAQAHPDRAVGLLLQHAGDLGFGGAPQDVDEALDLLEGDVVTGEHRLGDGGPHEALVVDELGLGEGLAEQTQIREAVLLEERPGETGDGDVELGEAPRQVEDFGGRRVVLEPAGVADDRRVQAHRGVAVQRQAERVDETVHDPPARRGVRLDHVDRPVPVVRDVVVDDHELRAPRWPLARGRRGGRATRSRR